MPPRAAPLPARQCAAAAPAVCARSTPPLPCAPCQRCPCRVRTVNAAPAQPCQRRPCPALPTLPLPCAPGQRRPCRVRPANAAPAHAGNTPPYCRVRTVNAARLPCAHGQRRPCPCREHAALLPSAPGQRRPSLMSGGRPWACTSHAEPPNAGGWMLPLWTLTADSARSVRRRLLLA
jgi:hypothetical protein